MRPLRYFAVFAVAAVVAAVLVAAVNAVVDPLGIVPGSPALAGLNAEKVVRFNNDRLHKPLDLRSARPRTVVLGTSRILQAFDPGTMADTPYAPAYNYGLAGGDLDELEGHLEKFIAPTPSVKYVFVELFLPRVVCCLERPVPGRPELLASALLSWSALQQSAETLWQNRRFRAAAATPGPIVLADGRQSFLELSTLPNFLAYPASVARKPSRYELTPSVRGSLRHMQEIARRHGIVLTFVLSPMHAVQLYALHVGGHWPVLEELKRTLALESPAIDFSRYTPIVEEPARAEMQYWSDPHHFSATTASMLAARLTGRAVAREGFGVPLVADGLEAELRAWAAARDRWIARNPGWQELFRRARAAAGPGLPALEDVPGGVPCPVRESAALRARLEASPGPVWVVASSRTTLDPPVRIDVRPAPADDETCELTIHAAPEVRGRRPVDWRMGHPLGSAAGVRGRTIRYTVRARASVPTALSAGTIYVHDGVRTTAAPLTGLTPAWQTVAVEHAVAPQASTLELWVRLIEGYGSIRPVGTRLTFEATVDLADAPR